MLIQLDHERIKEKNDDVKENEIPEKEVSSPIKTKQKSTTSTSIKVSSSKNVVHVRNNSASKNKVENKKTSSHNVPKIQTNTPVNNKASQKTPIIKPPKIPNPVSNADNKSSPKKTHLPPTDPKTKQSDEFRPALKNMSSVNTPGGLKKSSSKSKLTTSVHNLSIDKKLNKEEKKSGENKQSNMGGRILNKLTNNRSKSNSNLNHSMNVGNENKNNLSILSSPKTVKKDLKSKHLEQNEDLLSRSFENLKTKGEFNHLDETNLNNSAQHINIKNILDNEEKGKKRQSSALKKSSKVKAKKSELYDLQRKIIDCDKDLEDLESDIMNYGKVVSLKDEFHNNQSKEIF
jgi:hypothetical protein